MSERRLRFALAALIAVCGLLTSAGATAQTAEDARPERAELGARIDSLWDEYQRQSQVLQRSDSLRRVRAQQVITDTVAVGPFLVVEIRGRDVERTADAVRTAWRSYAPLVGLAAERLIGTNVSASLPDAFAAGRPGVRMYRFAPHVTGRADYPGAADRVMRNALTDALPEDVREWLGGASVSTGGGLDWAYRSLATAHSLAAHSCYEGDVRSCKSALGLIEPGSDRTAWYTPAQLRELVARSRPSTLPGWEECVEGGDHAQCLELLNARGPIPPPVPAGARGTLLAHALSAGGDGAYQRLTADAPDVAARIANAAGEPIDGVVADWHATVVEARPDMQAGMVRAGFWTIVWLAGLGLLAMRSTRWRLG